MSEYVFRGKVARMECDGFAIIEFAEFQGKNVWGMLVHTNCKHDYSNEDFPKDMKVYGWAEETDGDVAVVTHIFKGPNV